MFELQTIDRSKLYASIVDQIVEGIRAGAFPPSSALPSERHLSTLLGVSRGSVREAIRVLEHAGVLEVRTGSGTYVSDEGVSRAAALRATAALSGEHSPLDLLVGRRALEPLCAEAAAEHRSPSDMAELHRSVERHAALAKTGEDATEVDEAFHLTLAGAGHNPVLYLLVHRLTELRRESTWLELKNRSKSAEKTEQFIAHHRQIVDAVEQRDGVRAAELDARAPRCGCDDAPRTDRRAGRQSRMTTDRLGAAVVGAGVMGTRHARVLHDIEGVYVNVVADVDARRRRIWPRPWAPGGRPRSTTPSRMLARIS